MLCSECWGITCGEMAGPPPREKRSSVAVPASRPMNRGAAMIVQSHSSAEVHSRTTDRLIEGGDGEHRLLVGMFQKMPRRIFGAQAGSDLRMPAIAGRSAWAVPQPVRLRLGSFRFDACGTPESCGSADARCRY